MDRSDSETAQDEGCCYLDIIWLRSAWHVDVIPLLSMRPTISTVEITGVMVSTDFGFTVFSGYSRHVVKTMGARNRIQREMDHLRRARKDGAQSERCMGFIK
jgi:hypothetical protein